MPLVYMPNLYAQTKIFTKKSLKIPMTKRKKTKGTNNDLQNITHETKDL